MQVSGDLYGVLQQYRKILQRYVARMLLVVIYCCARMLMSRCVTPGIGQSSELYVLFALLPKLAGLYESYMRSRIRSDVE